MLKPILSTIPGHIGSSDEAIQKLRQIQPEKLERCKYPFSLDVVSMYTSIPAHPAVNLMTEYIASSNINCYNLTSTDIHQLLSVVVDNTYFTFHGRTYKQIKGLPMGSSLSGLLAITYMDRLERQALDTCHDYAFFSRYVDDIIILTSSRDEASNIAEAFSSVDKNIRFDMEHPDNTGTLPILDFRLKILGKAGIHTEFYRKPSSTDLFVHHKSALPHGAKIGYIRNEVARIRSKCSREEDQITHTTHFKATLNANGYPASFTKRMRHTSNPRHHTPSNTCFLRFPHFNEKITAAIRRAIKKEGLDIQIAHYGPSLRRKLSKNQNKTTTACTLANCPIQDTEICHEVHVVYQIQCCKCNQFYIGSTIRKLHIRIKEHLHTQTSSFHKHLVKCKNTGQKFTVTIKARERNLGNLRIKEAILIRKLNPQINNRTELNADFII